MPRGALPGSIVVCLVAATSLSAQDTRTPKLNGLLQLRETYQQHVMTATVHRARLYLDGAMSSRFTYRISADLVNASGGTTDATARLTDAFVRWSPSATWNVTVGQFKTPFSREYLLTPAIIETPDRAAVSELLPPKRDIGVMAAYALRTVATLSAGVFNGEGVNTLSNTDSTVLAVARMTVRPLAALDLGANVAAYGADSTRYGADAMITSGPASARAEFIGQHRDGGGTDDYGWYLVATYRVQPTLQLVLRQEDLRRPAVPEPRTIATTAGANLESRDQRVRLSLDYVSRQLGTGRSGTILAQLQLTF